MDHHRDYREQLNIALASLDLERVAQVRQVLAVAFEEERQVFLCGNGGSAATASHMANDLGKGASLGQAKRFKVLALTDNVSWMTAVANDISYEAIFAEQLKNYGRPDDVLIVISGSGNSQNVLNAVAAAKEIGMTTVGWSGFGGGKVAAMVDVALVVDSHHMGRVEDLHTIVMHMICYHFMETTVS
jgi:D-sedoheptulose 7-phosphate isomerase